jgi:hypothetical protein
MIKFQRPYTNKQLVSIYFLHKDLVYLIPTIQFDAKPIPKGLFAIRIYLFNLVIQITI